MLNDINTQINDGDDNTAEIYRDIINALEGVLVGRSQGSPAAGQDLGTLMVPWGTVHAQAISVGGRLVNLDTGPARRNAINSGKTRPGSALGGFIDISVDPQDPDPRKAFKGRLLATETPLNFTANGVSQTLRQDLNFYLEAPPVSGNTATMAAPLPETSTRGGVGLESRALYSGEPDIVIAGEAGTIHLGTPGTGITDLAGKAITLA